MSDRWSRSRGAVYNVGYHIIWCPKYRRSILKLGVEKRLKTLLYCKATELGIRIEKMENMPDHIHLFIKSDTNISIANIVKNLKGFTSRILRQEFPHLKNMKSLWTRSYYCETVGHISESTIKKYIQNQKIKG